MDRCQLRPLRFWTKVVLSRTGVSRRHEHLYFAAETVAPRRRLFNAWPACQFTRRSSRTTGDKFAIAVTRARVDFRDFFSLVAALRLCAPRITWVGRGGARDAEKILPVTKNPVKSNGYRIWNCSGMN